MGGRDHISLMYGYYPWMIEEPVDGGNCGETGALEVGARNEVTVRGETAAGGSVD